MKLRFTTFVVVVASACSGTQPSAPTSLAAPPSFTQHFSGVVLTEDGQPLPAATVSLRSPRGPANATSDGNGVYQLTLDQSASWAGTFAQVTHVLYDDTYVEVDWVPGQTDVTHNFRLYRTITLAAGDSARLTMTPDNSLCESDEVSFVCRIVHVTVPVSSTLVIDTIADDPSSVVRLKL